MNCTAFDLLLEKPETEWTAEERQAAERHAAQCPDCAMRLAMRREMRAMEADTAVPDTFTASWKYAIHAEAEKHMEKKHSYPWKRALAGIAAALVVGIGTLTAYTNDWGATAPIKANRETEPAEPVVYADDYEVEMAEEEAVYDSAAEMAAPMLAGGAAEEKSASYTFTNTTASSASKAASMAKADAGDARESKIVRTVSLSLRTRAYDTDYEALSGLAAQYGGRIDNRNTSGEGGSGALRWASFIMRIPTERLDDFIAAAKGIGSLASFSESADDVTDSYYDIDGRLATQRAKLQRLNQLMEQAESVSDLVEIESAASDAQYWIDYYTGQLQGYDSSIRDSRVYVDLQEISTAAAAESTDLSLGQRMINALHASGETAVRVLRALAVFLVAALPWFIALAALILIVRLIVKRKGKKEN